MTNVTDDEITFGDAYGELHVSKTELNLIRDAVLFIYPAMEPGVGYPAEAILGPDLWEPRSAGGRRFVGRCLAWLERTRQIPIRRVTPIGKYPVLYAR